MTRAGRTTIQGKYGDTLKIVAVDENGNIVGVLQGIDATGVLRTLKVDSDGQIISVIKGDQGVVAQDASNRLLTIIEGSEDLPVAQKAVTGELITVMQGAQGLDVAQQAVTGELVSVMKGIEGANLRTVALDSSGNIIGVMKGNYGGSLITIAVDSTGVMQADISKAERIEIIETVSTTHFTGAIVMNAHESENITGLVGNRYMIRGINVQSDQPLKFMLEFYGKDTFDSTDIDVDSFIDHVEIDLSSYPTFRVNGADQYKLNVGDLEILYEDYDATNELHISLHNLSPTTKAAGAAGAVQFDIKMSPRL